MPAYLSIGGGQRLPVTQYRASPIATDGLWAYHEVGADRASKATADLVHTLMPIVSARLGLKGVDVKWFSLTNAAFVRNAQSLWPTEHVWQDRVKASGFVFCTEPNTVYLDVDTSTVDMPRTLAHELQHVKQHKGFGPGHTCRPDVSRHQEREADEFAAAVAAAWNGD